MAVMERSTEIDREAEIAIKNMSDAEIRDMFQTEQVDILRREYNSAKRDAGRENIKKRWNK
ncbi:hypothetical protein LPTSP1_37210 [Leptospira johnsonii]|uniref:Uncharacterized protein n=2 Tax=Leptospira johnsonii TaxID=1917820 RepID=A0A2P2D7U4_9LEPT|nr:hypothetical protein LPTSP1_37210 [Leptospira johnsonii]